MGYHRHLRSHISLAQVWLILSQELLRSFRASRNRLKLFQYIGQILIINMLRFRNLAPFLILLILLLRTVPLLVLHMWRDTTELVDLLLVHWIVLVVLLVELGVLLHLII